MATENVASQDPASNTTWIEVRCRLQVFAFDKTEDLGSEVFGFSVQYSRFSHFETVELLIPRVCPSRVDTYVHKHVVHTRGH